MQLLARRRACAVDVSNIVEILSKLFAQELDEDGEFKKDAVPEEFMSMKGVFFRAKALGPVSVVGACSDSPFRPVGADSSLAHVVDNLTSDVGVHRVPVLSTRGRVKKIITQSGLVALLDKALADVGLLTACTLEELGLARKSVVTVQLDDITLKAWHQMHTRNISAVGVINDPEEGGGKLVACITATDVRWMIDPDHFAKGALSVRRFLEEKVKHRGHSLVTCYADTPLGVVIRRVARAKVHRVFVVDDSDLPIGVVSLRDILRVVASPPTLSAAVTAAASERAAGLGEDIYRDVSAAAASATDGGDGDGAGDGGEGEGAGAGGDSTAAE